VFDSKSASAGEVLVTIKIAELLAQGLQKAKLIEAVDSFIKQMKTYFVLENIDNLLKNGRIGKITGKLISVLNIKPIMGSDGDGNIELFSHARGQKQIIDKLADTIRSSGRETDGQSLVIAHCNNPGLAEKLTEAIRSRYRFRDILVVPTRGISTVYANNRGVIMAF
jgi:DegV family protein with EDD domain